MGEKYQTYTKIRVIKKCHKAKFSSHFYIPNKKSLSEGFSRILRKKNVLEHKKFVVLDDFQHAFFDQWSKADLKLKS